MASLSTIEEVEVLVHICSFLDPKDLGHLARASVAFGRKIAWGTGTGTELRSAVDESARRWVLERPERQQLEVTWAGGEGESWLGRMWAILTIEGDALGLIGPASRHDVCDHVVEFDTVDCYEHQYCAKCRYGYSVYVYKEYLD